MFAKTTRVPVKAHSIGYGQDWEDAYSTWYDVRDVDESGAILVRPDRVVAWRSKSAPVGGVQGAKNKLEAVTRSILGL